MRSRKTKKRPEPLTRARALFQQALDLPPTERVPFVQNKKGVSAPTKQLVLSLLTAHQADESLPSVAPSLPSSSADGEALAADDSAPARVGPYLLFQRLDSGGMAEIYLARKEGASGFEKEVALKCVLPKHYGNRRVQRWFEAEAKLGGRLSHPNIVSIFDFVQANDAYWLEMDYVQGHHLRQLTHRLAESGRTLPPAAVAYIGCELFKALEYAHGHTHPQSGRLAPVIHRDISPRNLLLSYQGEVKVVDFGIAKVNTASEAPETQMGIVKGTPGYMSPEQAAGRPLSPATDVFSSITVLFELFTLRPLFSGELRKGKALPVEVEKGIDSLPLSPALQAQWRRALSAVPGERPTPRELRLTLEEEYRSSAEFSPSYLSKTMASLFANEREQNRKSAQDRENRIRSWRQRGQLAPPSAPVRGSSAAVSWKQSPLIFALLLMTVMTSALNIYFQLVPDEPFFNNPSVVRELNSAGFCTVRLETSPESARAMVNRVLVGNTPTDLRMRCGEWFDLELRREGYREIKVEGRADENHRHLHFNLSR